MNDDRLVSDWTVSPDWRGTQWYRMGGLAGKTIPEQSPGYQICGTVNPGWFNGHHPTIAGETIDGIICFTYLDNTCSAEMDVKIKHCNEYYLYHLEELPYSLGGLLYASRYCGTHTTLIGKYLNHIVCP